MLFQLLITEVHPTPAAGEPEWVELHCQSSPTDLMGMRICDARTCALLPSLRVPAGAYAILTRDGAALREVRTLPSNAVVVECPLPSLGNTADRVELRRADSSIVDSVSYVVASGGKGRSIERGGADVMGAIIYSDVWLPSTAPDSATCGVSNSQVRYMHDLSITGIFCSDSSIHVGIRNAGMIDVSSCSVTMQIGSKIHQRTVAGLSVQQWASFNVDLGDVPITSRTQIVPIDVRIVRPDDRNENNTYARHIVLPPVHGYLMISEVLAEPSEEQCDFVEIWNGTADTIDLAGWKIEEEGGQLHIISYPAVLTPNGYLAMSSDTAIIRLTRGRHYALLKPSLNINAVSDSIMLLTPDGIMVDNAVYDRRFHAEHLASSRGHSLERRMPAMIGEPSVMWATSPSLQGATPGEENAVSKDYQADSAKLSVLNLPCATKPDSKRYPCTIAWNQPFEQAYARMFILNLDGSVVAQLLNGELIGRSGSIPWNGMRDVTHTPVAIGIYIAALECVDAATARVIQSVCPLTIGESP